MKNILIDARMYFHTGIGRFIRNRLQQMEEALFIKSGTLLLPEGCRHLSSRFEIIHTGVPIYSIREQFQLYQLTRKIAPSFYFSPHYILPFFPGYPCTFMAAIHDLSHFNFPGLKKYAARFYIRNALHRAQVILTGSSAIKNRILHHYPSYRGAVITLPHGVEDFFFRKADAPIIAAAREKFSLPARYWITSGGRMLHKNLELLKKMRPFLPAPVKDTPIAVLGNFGQRTKTEQDNFHYLPFMEDEYLPAVYQGAELMLFPSKSEGFGLPVLEAFAGGVPVLCSDIPVHREHFSDAALFFHPESPQEAADTVQKLLESPSLRNQMIEKGRATARKYSWEETKETFLKILENAYENSTDN